MIVVLAGLLSGVMFYLSQGLDNVWILAWLAPAPLLWLAYGGSPRWQVLAAGLAGFAAGQAYLLQCYWRFLPLSVIAPVILPMCVMFSLTVLLAGEALRRDSPVAALVGFPALWTAVEYGIEQLSPHGTFGALGYAEVSFPAGIQIASLFGVSAVTFLLCLSANAVALLLRRRWLTGAAGLAACMLVLLFGFLRLAAPEGPRLEAAALADADTWHAQNRRPSLASEEAAAQAYAAYVENLHGPRVVVIPEGAIEMRQGEEAEVLARLASAAKRAHAVVVAGTFVPMPSQNRAFAFLPDGRVETYAKRHLLLPFEPEAPGRTLGLLGQGYATQICKDMDFPGTVRGTAEHGVRLMTVPANDFGRDGWIHARMAIMRGVENGFAVVRSAFNGLETISDAKGRVLASASTLRAGMVAAVAEVPLGPGPTLYTRIGDVFPWLCAALCALIGMRWIPGVRRRLNVARAWPT
jgi:apolipoprotein N-acyltransferase